MSSSKRTSALPAGPKAPVSFALGLTISDGAILTGTHMITIASDTVIHPRAKILSTHGPVTIGRNCILSERSSLGLSTASASQTEGTVIEDGVILEVGAIVEAKSVGEGSLIEINARVGKGAVIGKVCNTCPRAERILILIVRQHCKIGPLCTVDDSEVVPDYTVIYGSGLRRVDHSGVEDLKLKMVGRQVDVLRRLIPSNHAKFQ